MTPELIEECKVVQQNCTYTAEAHHIIARRYGRLAFWLQLVPAIIAAITGVLAKAGYHTDTFIWFTVLSAAVAAVANVLNPQKTGQEHVAAAKGFTTLKQDARALHRSFGHAMTDDAFQVAVRNLHDRYNDLVRSTVETDEPSFQKAREKVQKGIHDPDRDAAGEVR